MVCIVMGSANDWPIMQGAAELLTRLQVPYEVTVSSAHRAPQRTAELAQHAAARGIQVMIAGAGGAAHLAGVIASGTTLPVIGVPIDSSALQGLDALLATVQMPQGVPVATVAIAKPGQPTLVFWRRRSSPCTMPSWPHGYATIKTNSPLGSNVPPPPGRRNSRPKPHDALTHCGGPLSRSRSPGGGHCHPATGRGRGLSD